MHEILEQLYKTKPIEVVGMATGLLFPIFASLEKKICWLFGFISSVAYTWIMFDGKLYQDAALSIFYAIMAVYGYLVWQGMIKEKNQSAKISYTRLPVLLLCLLIGVAYFFAGGFVFDH